MLSQDSEDEFDQDLCLSLCHGLKKSLWQDELNPRVRCAFGNVLPVIPLLLLIARRWTVRNICSDTFNWVVPYFPFIQADTLASIISFILINCSI